MPLLRWMLFLMVYTTAGLWLVQFIPADAITPDFFVPLLIYLAVRPDHPTLLPMVVMLGLASDILHASNWAVHGTAYLMIYWTIRKSSMFIPWKLSLMSSIAGMLAIVTLANCEVLISGQSLDWGWLMWKLLFSMTFFWPCWTLFHILRLPWALGRPIRHQPF